MAKVKTVKFGPFKGINNVSDPISMGPEFCSEIVNMNVTDHGSLKTRKGCIKTLSGSFHSLISTSDFRRMYAVKDNVLVQVYEDGLYDSLLPLVGKDQMNYMEINLDLYFHNGVDSGIIKDNGSIQPWLWEIPVEPTVNILPGSGSLDDGEVQVCITKIMPDGRETGAGPASFAIATSGSAIEISNFGYSPSTPTLIYIKPPKSTVFQLAFEASGPVMTFNSGMNDLGMELLSEFTIPMKTDFIDFVEWNGSVAAMEYDPVENMTYVWFSEPLIYHLFKTDNYIPLKGKGTMLASTPDALVIGMENTIEAWDGKSIKNLARFGACFGRGVVADDNNSVLIWTQRGLCSVFPFVRIMEKNVSVPSSDYVCMAMIEENGAKRVVAVTQSNGEPFNQRIN